ncbi:uncharacterized protein LOC144134973 [Amblyomma americanum]
MCINSRGEIFALSVVCTTYNALFVFTHSVNFVGHLQFAALHGFYVVVHSLGIIIAVLLFVSIITRRATPMEVGVFLCKGRIIITSMEIGYLGYRVAMGFYDLPLHFFKRKNGDDTVPLAWAFQRAMSRRPTTERDWRKFYHLSYLFMEISILIIDVYATWRIDLFIDKVLYRQLFF